MDEHRICDTWGRVTDEERRAREHILFCVRLQYLSGPDRAYDQDTSALSEEFKRQTPPGTPLSVAYELLSPRQKAGLRESIDNPPVRFIDMGGRGDWRTRSYQHVLSRLENGEHVGPADQKRVERPVGTKVTPGTSEP